MCIICPVCIGFFGLKLLFVTLIIVDIENKLDLCNHVEYKHVSRKQLKSLLVLEIVLGDGRDTIYIIMDMN